MYRLVKLGSWILGLWFFFAVVTPRLVALSPAWQHYDAVQEEFGLNSGDFYYSNVPVTQSSEEHVRWAVREGMLERQQARHR